MRPGDTLSGIAQQLCGDGSLWRTICSASHIADCNRINPGMLLCLPPGCSGSASPPPSPGQPPTPGSPPPPPAPPPPPPAPVADCPLSVGGLVFDATTFTYYQVGSTYGGGCCLKAIPTPVPCGLDLNTAQPVILDSLETVPPIVSFDDAGGCGYGCGF